MFFRNVILFWIRELLKNGLKINVKVYEDFNFFNFFVLIYKIWKKILYLFCFCVLFFLEDLRIVFILNLRKGEFDGFCCVFFFGDFGWGGKIGFLMGNCWDNNEWFFFFSKFFIRNEGEGLGWFSFCV